MAQPNCDPDLRALTIEQFPYVWRWRVKHGERHAQRCRVWARGSMNSIGVEFPDGFKTVTARYAVRKASSEPSAPARPFEHDAQPARQVRLEVDGRTE